jgi:hypothetical protein
MSCCWGSVPGAGDWAAMIAVLWTSRPLPAPLAPDDLSARVCGLNVASIECHNRSMHVTNLTWPKLPACDATFPS